MMPGGPGASATQPPAAAPNARAGRAQRDRRFVAVGQEAPADLRSSSLRGRCVIRTFGDDPPVESLRRGFGVPAAGVAIDQCIGLARGETRET